MAGAADKTNPSILVSHGPLLGGEGNNPLVFDKLGQFAVNSFNGLTGSVDTTSLTLPVAGITASSGISCGGNLFIGGDIIINDNLVRGPGGSEILMSFLDHKQLLITVRLIRTS